MTVTDEGEGIPERLHDRVFTRFWRPAGAGHRARPLHRAWVVEAHGGHIEVGRAPSGGALFRFVLPAGTPDFLDRSARRASPNGR